MKFKKFVGVLSLLFVLIFAGCDLDVLLDDFSYDTDWQQSQSVTPVENSVESVENSDYISIHLSDIDCVDFDELIMYQEDAVYLPDTADLDAISYRIVNNNIPYFSDNLKVTDEFEIYSELDDLGRCGMAFANISAYTMPNEERGSIGSVKPSGWQSVKYDNISGKYLYNRCHLIGYQLAAENANECNLITGTRHLNIQGMLGFENAVANYVQETGNHVLYAVTPVFKDNELVARGVLMEAYSVEDSGVGIQFCAFCYNNQPGIVIDYATGDSRER